MKQFSIKEALNFGWETFKKYPWLLIGITLTVTIIPSLASYLIQLPFQTEVQRNSDEFTPAMLLGTVLSSLLSAFFTLGIIRLSLKLVDGKRIEYQDLFTIKADEYLRYIIGSLIYSVIVVVGLVLLIIPGVIWGIKYQYFSYLIMDKNLQPMDAIKKSGSVTQGHKWNLFLFSIVIGLLSLLGIVALFVGLLVVAPVTGIAQAFVYRKLSSSKS